MKRKLPKIKHPQSSGSVILDSVCRACGYKRGLLIVRFDGDSGFVRCGACDSPQYSVVKQGEEV